MIELERGIGFGDYDIVDSGSCGVAYMGTFSVAGVIVVVA